MQVQCQSWNCKVATQYKNTTQYITVTHYRPFEWGHKQSLQSQRLLKVDTIWSLHWESQRSWGCSTLEVSDLYCSGAPPAEEWQYCFNLWSIRLSIPKRPIFRFSKMWRKTFLNLFWFTATKKILVLISTYVGPCYVKKRSVTIVPFSTLEGAVSILMCPLHCKFSSVFFFSSHDVIEQCWGLWIK